MKTVSIDTIDLIKAYHNINPTQEGEATRAVFMKIAGFEIKPDEVAQAHAYCKPIIEMQLPKIKKLSVSALTAAYNLTSDNPVREARIQEAQAQLVKDMGMTDVNITKIGAYRR